MSSTKSRLWALARRVERLNTLIEKYPTSSKREERRAVQWALSTLIRFLQVRDAELQAKSTQFENERMERKEHERAKAKIQNPSSTAPSGAGNEPPDPRTETLVVSDLPVVRETCVVQVDCGDAVGREGHP